MVSVPLPQGSGLASSASWTTTGGTAGELLGEGLASAGDVNGDGFDDFLVGVPNRNTPYAPTTTEGAVLLFLGSPTGPSTIPDLLIENDQSTNIGFGKVVGRAGDVNGDGYDDVFVAAPNERTGVSTGFGTVRVFHGDPGGLNGGMDAVTGDADWYGECVGLGVAGFGRSVAAAGDVDGDGYDDLFVGAPEATSGAGTSAGAVFLWLGSPAGLNGGVDGSATNAAWKAEGTAASMRLGNLVASAGDLDGDGLADLLAQAKTYGGTPNAGHVFVWLGREDVLLGDVASASFDLAPPVPGSNFGEAATAADIDLDSRDDLVLGMYQAVANGATNGCVFRFSSLAGGLALDPWTSCGSSGGEQRGRALALGDYDGDALPDLAIGSPGWRPGGNVPFGRAICHYGDPLGLRTSFTWSITGTQGSAFFSERMANAGDVNGDGADDLLVGAPKYSAGGMAFVGQVWLFLGQGPQPIGCANAAPPWRITGTPPEFDLGGELAGVGDVNGDGYEDFVVKVFETFPVVRLHRGGPMGPERTSMWEVSGPRATPYDFAWIVAGAGDVNGDGYDDVLISENGDFQFYTSSPTTFVPGYVRIYHGGPVLPDTTFDWEARLLSPNPVDFGWAAAGIGDVNEDGIDDVAVGAPGHTPSTYGNDPFPAANGAVYVWYGPLLGTADETTADWIATSDQADDRFGASLGRAGDVDGDGIDDLLVGAPVRDGLFDHAGATYLWRGSAPSGLAGGTPGTTGNAAWSATGQWDLAYFGALLAGNGDLDGDDKDDLAVCSLYDQGVGSVSVFYGESPAPSSSPDLVLRGVAGSYRLGTGARILEDFNGDGYSDLALQANVSNPEKSEGRIWIHHGGANGVNPLASAAFESDVVLGLLGHYQRFDGADVNRDGLTDLVAGCPGWPGIPVAKKQPGAVMLWYGARQTSLAVAPSAVKAGTPVRFSHIGGAPGSTITLRLVAVNSVPFAPVTIAVGTVDAYRCFSTSLAVPAGTSVASYSFQAQTLDDAGSPITSNRADVQVVLHLSPPVFAAK
jgi:hypothetical protein